MNRSSHAAAWSTRGLLSCSCNGICWCCCSASLLVLLVTEWVGETQRGVAVVLQAARLLRSCSPSDERGEWPHPWLARLPALLSLLPKGPMSSRRSPKYVVLSQGSDGAECCCCWSFVCSLCWPCSCCCGADGREKSCACCNAILAVDPDPGGLPAARPKLGIACGPAAAGSVAGGSCRGRVLLFP